MAQLQFKGKTFVQNHHLLVKYHELVPVKAKSLTSIGLIAHNCRSRFMN